MSFLDKAKGALDQAKGRAGRLAGQHRDKIDHAIDKSGSYLDQRTGGKYSDKVHKARDSAHSAATRLAEQHRESEQASSPKAPEEPAADTPQPVDPDPLAPRSNGDDLNRP
jgi:hypothetical protein